MTRTERLEAAHGPATLRCEDCRSFATADAPYCLACGGRLLAPKKSRAVYDVIAAVIGVGAVLLYWLGAAS